MGVVYRLPTAGEKVGDYLILEKLGQGGFGTVFKAECQGQFYALKFIHSRELQPWGRREADALLRVLHPCIVRLHGFGVWPHLEPIRRINGL